MVSKVISVFIILVVIVIISGVFKSKEDFTTTLTTLTLANNNVEVPNDTTMEFGRGVSGKQGDAGKIRYGGWYDALNVVGAGKDGHNRLVRVWDRLKVGPIEFQNDGCIQYGPGNKYKFCFQKDGNVVQYKNGQPVWATNKYE